MGKMYTTEILTTFKDLMDLPMIPTQWETQTTHKGIFTLPFQATGLPEQCVPQIQ